MHPDGQGSEVVFLSLEKMMEMSVATLHSNDFFHFLCIVKRWNPLKDENRNIFHEKECL